MENNENNVVNTNTTEQQIIFSNRNGNDFNKIFNNFLNNPMILESIFLSGITILLISMFMFIFKVFKAMNSQRVLKTLSGNYTFLNVILFINFIY